MKRREDTDSPIVCLIKVAFNHGTNQVNTTSRTDGDLKNLKKVFF